MAYPVPQNRQRTVFAVDPHPEHYAKLTASMESEGLHLEVFKNGRAALRRTASPAPELWLVNMRLDDISGPDLLAMLRWLNPGVPVYLVSDDYSEQDEVEARCAGAELYLCKPLEPSWLTAAMMQQHAS